MASMKRQTLAILLSAAGSAALLAADISGAYAGIAAVQTPNGERQRQTTIVIKQTPEKLIVSVGPNVGEQHPASNVKLDGDKLTFDVVPPGAERPAMKFDLRIEADKLTGTHIVMLRNDETRTGKVDLKKQ